MGSGHVVPELTQCRGGSRADAGGRQPAGRRGHRPQQQRGTLVGDYLNTLGFDPRVEPTGTDGFQQAAANGDTAIAVVHLNAIRWELSQTVANLRADSRTADLPIAIYGPVGMQGRVEHLTGSYPLVSYVEETNDAIDLMKQLRPLLAQVSPPKLTDDQRLAQRKAAAMWLEHIASGQRTELFDLAPAEKVLADNVNDLDVGRSCIIALGAISTPTAQQRLLDTAVGDSIEPACGSRPPGSWRSTFSGSDCSFRATTWPGCAITPAQ